MVTEGKTGQQFAGVTVHMAETSAGTTHTIAARTDGNPPGSQLVAARDIAAKDGQPKSSSRPAIIIAARTPRSSTEEYQPAQLSTSPGDQPSQRDNEPGTAFSGEPESVTRQEGFGGGGTPPSQNDEAGFDDGREEIIQRLLARNAERLQAWQWDTSQRPRLDLTHEALYGLIPEELLRHERVYPERVRIKIEDAGHGGRLSFFITQENPTPLSEIEWEQLRQHDEDDKRPENVDPMLWRLGQRTISLKKDDIPIAHIQMHMIQQASDKPAGIYIEYLEVNETMREGGIATGLHDQARQFAKDQGFHAMVAQSGEEVADTFISMGFRRFGDLLTSEKETFLEDYGEYFGKMSGLIIDDLSRPLPEQQIKTPPDSPVTPPAPPEPAVLTIPPEPPPAQNGTAESTTAVRSVSEPTTHEEMDDTGRPQIEKRSEEQIAEPSPERKTIGRREGWPDITIGNFFSHHETKDDLQGLAEVLSGADVYLIQGNAARVEEMQHAANINPTEIDVDSYIDQYNGFAMRSGRPSILGTALEAELHAVFGTGVIIGQMDTRRGDPVTREDIINEAKVPYIDTNFGTTLTNLYDKYKILAEYHTSRQDIAVNYRLEEALESIFAQHHELMELEGSSLRVVVAWEDLHEGTLDVKMRAQEVTTVDFSPKDRFNFPSNEIIKTLMMDGQPTRDELIRAHLENIMTIFMQDPDDEPLESNTKLAQYFQNVTSQFGEDEVEYIHNLFVTSNLSKERLNWLLQHKGLGPLPKTNAELITALDNFAAQRAAESHITTFINGTTMQRESAETAFAQVIAEGDDIGVILDSLSTINPEAAEQLAESATTLLTGYLESLSIDNLTWLYANMPADANKSALQNALFTTAVDSHHAEALMTAADWAEFDDKTITRIRTLASIMDAYEENVKEHARSIPLTEILRRNVKPGKKMSDRELKRFSIQPVIATEISEPPDEREAKIVKLSSTNEATRISNPYDFGGDGPLGFALFYKDIPQGLVSFDSKYQTVYIRQIKQLRTRLERKRSGEMRHVMQDTLLDNFNFQGVAIDLVGQLCDRLAIPPLQEGELIIPREDLPELNPTINSSYEFQPVPLDQVLQRYEHLHEPNGLTIMVNTTEQTGNDLRRYLENVAADIATIIYNSGEDQTQ